MKPDRHASPKHTQQPCAVNDMPTNTRVLLDATLDNLPPTVNHYYRTGRRIARYKTAAGKVYQALTVAAMLQARRCGGTYTGPVALSIVLTSRTRRRWDLDNRVKAVQDCLQLSGIIADDSQITELHVIRDNSVRKDSTRVTVTTRPAPAG